MTLLPRCITVGCEFRARTGFRTCWACWVDAVPDKPTSVTPKSVTPTYYCEWCGQSIPARRFGWCSDACRKTAYARRVRRKEQVA